MGKDIIATKVAYTQDQERLIKNMYNKINNLVNIINYKDTAIYNNEEIHTSQKWFIGEKAGQQKMVYRVVIKTGALVNTGTTTTAHNLPVTQDWNFIEISGTANSSAFDEWIPLNDANISIKIDLTDIIITTDADFSDFDSSNVILLYTKA